MVGPACFHSQQAAEKALKAALVLESIEFPYVHDLRRLRNLLPDGWPGGGSNIALQRLTEWGAESRYPGDWPELTAEDGPSRVPRPTRGPSTIPSPWSSSAAA